MIAMLVLASMLWVGGTFFDHDTMHSYRADNRAALEDLATRRREYWARVRGGAPFELGLSLFIGTKEDRLER
jgi:hypothetical protein